MRPRWQYIEDTLVRFFMEQDFSVYDQGDKFAEREAEDVMNLSELAREIDKDLK